MLSSVLVWFRRDLRDVDNTALDEALRRAQRVYCAFIFDLTILDSLPSRNDRRVEFIAESLRELDAALRQRGGCLMVVHAHAEDAIPELARKLGVAAVFANRDYEPEAKVRDARVAAKLSALGIGFESFKDQVIFDGLEVLTQNDRPYTVFTPYKKTWLKRLGEEPLAGMGTPSAPGVLATSELSTGIPELEAIGFSRTNLRDIGIRPGMSGASTAFDDFLLRITRYHEQRDYPAIKGVSYLSIHLRFGTISIRQLVAQAISKGALANQEGAACWLSELIWREFYFMILEHFPAVVERSFKPEYDAIEWVQGEAANGLFAAWCKGETGYPLVDAAMRQLNATGYMHNRLRMVSASFLCKDLGIDWRRGEAYFAAHLNDFDLSANNGGWQWASSSGCDAQPYFRIFNPVTQSERFDPQGRFIRRYVPELTAVPDKFIHAPWRMTPQKQAACGVILGRDTPKPLVSHDEARLQTLARYAVVKTIKRGAVS